MFNTTFRRQGDPVQCGFTIGRAPLALRGIRFAEGEGGAAPAAAPAAPAAPSPAQVAAMLANVNGTPTPAAPAPTPAPQQIQGFTPEQVQKLMADNAALQKQFEETRAQLTTTSAERDEAKSVNAANAREKAVTTASAEKANAALLLDSASFQTAIKDVDLTDDAALSAAVEAFVKDNPAYGAVQAPALPNTSGGTPAGGTNETPKTLEGAIAARLAG